MSPETRSKCAVIGLLAIAIGFSSYAETRVLVVDDYDFSYQTPRFELAALEIEYLAVETEILTPKFANNFNRLVVFPELGSRGVLKGHRLTIRGPPKS